MRLSDLRDKHVVIWGAGREAKAVLHALRRYDIDADIRIVDEKAQSGAELEGVAVQQLDTGVLRAADVVVRSPGISKYRPELDGLTVTTATNLFFAEKSAPVVAVTGTKGKSTTSSLIAHLLNGLGTRAVLAGNIGRSPLDLVGEDEPDWWVLELSSFQTSDLVGSPELAVLTTLSPEHLDWHGGEENYFADKLRLLHSAKRRLANMSDPGVSARVHAIPDVIPVDDSLIVPPSQLLGTHNAQLIRVALSALRAIDIDLEAHKNEISNSLAAFAPLPHRLEPVVERNGVLYVNDSLATTPIATMAAIEAFVDRPVTVLVGGYDRGVSYDDFGDYVDIHDNVTILTLPDSGDRIAAAIRGRVPTHHTDGLAEAVALAARITPAGGVVLLSPGAASFGHFTDYAERGEVFRNLAEQVEEPNGSGDQGS